MCLTCGMYAYFFMCTHACKNPKFSYYRTLFEQTSSLMFSCSWNQCTYACMHVHVSRHVNYEHVLAYACLLFFAILIVFINECTQCMYVCMYVYVYVCMCVCMYTSIHMHIQYITTYLLDDFYFSCFVGY